MATDPSGRILPGDPGGSGGGGFNIVEVGQREPPLTEASLRSKMLRILNSRRIPQPHEAEEAELLLSSARAALHSLDSGEPVGRVDEAFRAAFARVRELSARPPIPCDCGVILLPQGW